MTNVPPLDLISSALESCEINEQLPFLRQLLHLTAAGLVAKEGPEAAFEDLSRAADGALRLAQPQ